MKHLLSLFVLSCCLSSAAVAGDGSAPLCATPSLPNCVIANWGLVQPDGIEGLTATPNRDAIASASAAGGKRMSVALLPTAMASKSTRAPLNAVVSPVMLFRQETNELVAALQRARFDKDGTIVRGRESLVSAAARLVDKADAKYQLTIYIKVPQRFRPDDSASLSKRVRSVNDILGSAVQGAPRSGTPG